MGQVRVILRVRIFWHAGAARGGRQTRVRMVATFEGMVGPRLSVIATASLVLRNRLQRGLRLLVNLASIALTTIGTAESGNGDTLLALISQST